MKNEYEDYERYMKNRPHVVILGAGASCAAIPNGDKHGKKISAMSGFIEKLGLSSVISKVDIRTSSDNLEDIYMELDERSKADPLCQEVKEVVLCQVWVQVKLRFLSIGYPAIKAAFFL